MNISDKSKGKKKWLDDSQGQTFFPQGKLNSCEVTKGFYGTEKIKLIDKKNDVKGSFFFLLKLKLIMPSMF